METKVFNVEGMSCSHCESNITRSLLKVEGIQEVTADKATSTVKVSGIQIDPKKIESAVTAIGFLFKGEFR